MHTKKVFAYLLVRLCAFAIYCHEPRDHALIPGSVHISSVATTNDWDEYYDYDSGYNYYVNRVSGDTQVHISLTATSICQRPRISIAHFHHGHKES